MKQSVPDTQKMLSKLAVIIIITMVMMMIMMLTTVIQSSIPFLVKSMVQTGNRSERAVEEGMHKPSCSIWALTMEFRREVSLEDSPVFKL